MNINKPDARLRRAELCRTARRLLPAGAARAQDAMGAQVGVAAHLGVGLAPAPPLTAVWTRTAPRDTVPAVCRRRPQLDLQNQRSMIQLFITISKGLFLTSIFRSQTYVYLRWYTYNLKNVYACIKCTRCCPFCIYRVKPIVYVDSLLLYLVFRKK